MIELIIDSYIAELNNNEICDKDNVKFRVSDAGRCHRMRYWKRQGKPASDLVDSRTKRVFEVGHIFHKWVQNILLKQGVLESMEVRVEDTHRVGHADALIRTPSGLVLYDFKTVHSRKFHHKRKEGADIHYLMQAVTYATMLPVKVSDIRIAYISKDDLCIEEVSVFEYEGIQSLTEKDWNDLIFAWEKQIEPEPKPMQEWECKYCIYRTECLTSINTRQ